MPDAPTRQDLAMRLADLALEMREVAVLLDYYGGFSWQQSAQQLLGAAEIAAQWSAAMGEGDH